LFGDYLEATKDFKEASKVYRENCDDHKYGKSCLKFENYSFQGKGRATGSDKGDPKLAYKYCEKGCDVLDPDSCLQPEN
jgi:cytochrome c oxidase assembly factor 7